MSFVCLPDSIAGGKKAEMMDVVNGKAVRSSADLAIDGVTTQRLARCSHVVAPSPWWRVQLDDTYLIHSVHFTTCTDQCSK